MGRGDAPVLHRAHEGAARESTADVSCCEFIDVVQATEYRVLLSPTSRPISL
jgi:hypothetical protein